MAKIRAVTFFLKPPSWDKGVLGGYVAEAGSRLIEALRGLGIAEEVWSTRLSLPPLPQGIDPVEVAQAVQEALDESQASFSAAVHLSTSDARLERLPEALEQPGVYGSIRLESPGHAGRAAEIMAEVSRRDPEAATRLALDLTGKGLHTPYYPMSSNMEGDESIGLALLYTGELLAGARSGGIGVEARRVFEWAVEQGHSIAERLGVRFAGLDVSPSPWMEMSVARVVETISGRPLGAPGSLAAVRMLNEEVWRAGEGLPLIGFNETMLPVAEDNVLKERVLSGELRVRDLALLTLGCLAGIDMVVLPGEYGESVVRGLILDQLVVYRVKSRPLGMRLILYDGVRPGDKVRLGKFGEVPVSEL
jgi:uncharacterized protein (UPF0210 family)